MGTTLAWGVAWGAGAAGFLYWSVADAASLVILTGALALGVRAGGSAMRCLARHCRRFGLSGAETLLPEWPPAASRAWPNGWALPGATRRRAAAWGLGVLLGVLGGAARLEVREAALRTLERPRLAWLGGVAEGPWQLGRYEATAYLGEARLFGSPCTIAGERRRAAGGEAIPGKVQVRAAYDLVRHLPLEGGEWVCVRAVVARPPEGEPWPAFSPRRYWLARGVVASLTVRLPGRMQVVLPGEGGRAPSSVRAVLAARARRLSQAVRERSGRMAGAWFEAVAFGNRQALPEADGQRLRASGLGHLTSVSGLHVGLASAPLLAVAGRFRRRRRLAGVMAAVACALGWAYGAATGMQAPAVRALIVQGAGLAISLAGRRPNLLQALGWAAAAQLLDNPALAPDGGFQLSYAATSGIALALRWASGWAGQRGQGPEPPEGTPGRRWSRPFRSLGRTAAVSAGAWLFSAPLLVRFLGSASPWGVLISPPAAFLTLALIWSGLGAGLLPPPLAGAFALAARGAARGLEALSAWGAEASWRWPLGWLAARGWEVAAAAAAGRLLGARYGMGGLGAVAALVLAAAWPGQGETVVSGNMLGRSGWVVSIAPPAGPGVGVIALPGGARGEPEAVAAPAALGGLRRVGLLVVRTDSREPIHSRGPHIPLPGWSPTALLWDPATGRLVARAFPPREGPADERSVVASVGAVRLAAGPPGTGDGRAAAGLWVEIAAREGRLRLRIDEQGCVYPEGGLGPHCPRGRGFRLSTGPGGWGW